MIAEKKKKQNRGLEMLMNKQAKFTKIVCDRDKSSDSRSIFSPLHCVCELYYSKFRVLLHLLQVYYPTQVSESWKGCNISCFQSLKYEIIQHP